MRQKRNNKNETVTKEADSDKELATKNQPESGGQKKFHKDMKNRDKAG